MRCASCGGENRDDARFCGDCGETFAVHLSYPSCGAAYDLGRKFCDEWGQSLNRGRIYRPDDAFVNSDNPRIRAMVDPLLELAARTQAEPEHFDALGARDKVAKY